MPATRGRRRGGSSTDAQIHLLALRPLAALDRRPERERPVLGDHENPAELPTGLADDLLRIGVDEARAVAELELELDLPAPARRGIDRARVCDLGRDAAVLER